MSDQKADHAARVVACALALLLLGGCAQTDSERLDRKIVAGVDCIVVRDGIGKAQAIDCDWSGAHR